MSLRSAGYSFPVTALQEENGTRAKLEAGETIYGFFKTSCPTCALTWPFLDRIRAIAPEGPLRICAVSQDEPGLTTAFNERLGVSIRTLFDRPPWPASEALRIDTVPTLFRVAGNGEILATIAGFQKTALEDIARRAAELSQRPPTSLFRADEQVPAIKPG